MEKFYLKYQATILKIISGFVTALIFAIVFYFTTKSALADFDKRIESNTEAIKINTQKLNTTKDNENTIIYNLETVIDNLKAHIKEQGGTWKDNSKIELKN